MAAEGLPTIGPYIGFLHAVLGDRYAHDSVPYLFELLLLLSAAAGALFILSCLVYSLFTWRPRAGRGGRYKFRR